MEGKETMNKLLVVMLLVVGPHSAFADDPTVTRRLGGCAKEESLCWGPSATLSLASINLSHRKFSSNFIPGVGYGVTFFANTSYSLGLSGYFSLTQGDNGLPDVIVPSAVLSFAEYVRLGIGARITDDTSTVKGSTDWLLLIGFGLDIGSTPQTKHEANAGISSSPTSDATHP